MPNTPAAAPSTPPIQTSIAPLAATRAAWLVDIWGVIHNGVAPFASAVAACRTYRAGSGVVILVSNAPRPSDSVVAQLDRIGVDRSAYDAIVTSGDMSRALVSPYAAQPVLHVGPERDRPLFEGTGAQLAGADAAVAIVCTGLADDETETPETYRPLLAPLAARGVPMVCANPDLHVERGGRLIPCAGAVAAMYEALGGTVAYAGKPHLPIYEFAHRRVEALAARSLTRGDILAIGDGLATDIAGAAAYGIDSVYVASAVSLGGAPFEAATLARLFPAGGPRPVAAMAELAW